MEDWLKCQVTNRQNQILLMVSKCYAVLNLSLTIFCNLQENQQATVLSTHIVLKFET